MPLPCENYHKACHLLLSYRVKTVSTGMIWPLKSLLVQAIVMLGLATAYASVSGYSPDCIRKDHKET